MGGRVFLLQVEGVGGVLLHPVGHLVLGDAGDGFGIADVLGDFLVEPVECVERPAAEAARDAGGVVQIEHRLALGSALHALIDGRQVARAPDGFAGVGIFSAGSEDDESGQILVFRAESVSRPRADGRRAEVLAAGVHEQLRGAVVELVSVHRLDEAHVIDHRGKVRQPVG